ncbi:hypothetical protein PPO43_14325 [Saprospira sp. CCB-QB6]|nr:hypothetical protein [Saprospira sp. CCB-QB6]WCL81147.1 hypothetical protein PPO43_14325 [Saprospira sp. CCB-QB6]
MRIRTCLFWGPPQLRCGATLQGSQACSALRRQSRLGLAFGHPSTSLGQTKALRAKKKRHQLYADGALHLTAARIHGLNSP